MTKTQCDEYYCPLTEANKRVLHRRRDELPVVIVRDMAHQSASLTLGALVFINEE